MKGICCGIVTYNPSLKRLSENLAAIAPQVSEVFIYDNGSNNIAAIIERFQSDNCHIFNSGENSGMAVALNALAHKAIDKGYDYILLLDQDSVASSEMVSKLLRHCAPEVGIVSPITIDRNVNNPESSNFKEAHNVNWAITSGSLLALKAYSNTPGYDERLFVDLVDIDYCLTLRNAGFSIIEDPTAKLLHELGKKEFALFFPTRKIGGGIQWRQYRSNHSSFRRYDYARSRTILFNKRKDASIYKDARIRIAKASIMSFLCERHKLDWLRQNIRGYRDGMCTVKQWNDLR